MPTWTQRLREASFAGVPFGVRESETAGGRRAAVHQYPLREKPFVEDLGREARRYQVEGFLVGDDAAILRDRLQAAFESAAPGPRRVGRVLVHPTYGEVSVVCLSHRFRESTEEGRLIRFFADFIESGEELEPSSTLEPAGAADQAAEELATAGAEAFEDGAMVAGVVEQAREGVAAVVRDAMGRLRALDVFSGPLRDVERLEAAITGLLASLASLVASPADLAARVLQALDAVLDAAPGPAQALEAYRVLFEFPPLEDGGPGYQGDLARENARLTSELVRVGAVGGAVRAAARVGFASVEDAQEVREDLQDQLDLLAGEVSDDVLLRLEALRSVLARSVPPPDADLPHLRTLTLAQTRPALVIAHELYQDPGRAAELLERNHLRHPLRLPGGVPLLVLSA